MDLTFYGTAFYHVGHGHTLRTLNKKNSLHCVHIPTDPQSKLVVIICHILTAQSWKAAVWLLRDGDKHAGGYGTTQRLSGDGDIECWIILCLSMDLGI